MDLNIPPNPLSQIPSTAPLTKQHRHREFFVLAIAIVVVATGLIWWQIIKLDDESTLTNRVIMNAPNPENREISNISNEVNGVDNTNLDQEFEQIDKDLNSL
jgi:hypothetical protein